MLEDLSKDLFAHVVVRRSYYTHRSCTRRCMFFLAFLVPKSRELILKAVILTAKNRHFGQQYLYHVLCESITLTGVSQANMSFGYAIWSDCALSCLLIWKQ